MNVVFLWVVGGMFALGVGAGTKYLHKDNCPEVCPVVFLAWPIALGAIIGEANTTTIHKQQDRVSLPCLDQGEGGH